jgi:glycosyltransferase involved in cell wall biosynthesis
MNIAIYLDAIDFRVPSHQRLHAAILEGLIRANAGRHNFTVLTQSPVKEALQQPSLRFVSLRKNGRLKRRWGILRAGLASSCFHLFQFFGLGRPGLNQLLHKWKNFEPAYYAQLRELKIDVLWSPTGIDLPSPLPYIKTVLDVNHRIHPEYWPRETLQQMEELLSSIRAASFIITGTNEGKRQLAALYNVYESRVRVIPFPTPLMPEAKDIPAPKPGVESPYIFYPARFWRHKNHVVAVAALKILRDKWNIKINLVLSGKGGPGEEMDGPNLSYVMDYARTLGVIDQVKHVGEVPLAELSALYKHALALAFVSATGPDNLPPLEAMSMGCPAIVADVPGAREQYGDACLFFPPTDEKVLAEHIKFLLENPKDREALIAKGFARAKKWTVDDYGADLVSLFDEFALIARAWGSSSAVYL